MLAIQIFKLSHAGIMTTLTLKKKQSNHTISISCIFSSILCEEKHMLKDIYWLLLTLAIKIFIYWLLLTSAINIFIY